MNMHHI
jgi:pantothenate kinase